MFATLDSILGVIALCVALTFGRVRGLSAIGLTTFAVVGAYGIASLIASYGLARGSRYGLSFHRMASIVCLAASAIAMLRMHGTADFKTTVLLVVTPANFAMASMSYFGRPEVRACYQTLNDSGTWRGGVLIAVDVAVILFFFGFVVPGLISHRSLRPKRTMADMRSLATAVEAYATDANRYPDVRSVDDLKPIITPTYIKILPVRDGWGNEFRYEAWRLETDQGAGLQHFAVGSPGRDRKFELPSLRRYTRRETHNFDCDIVYTDGEFISHPQGAQDGGRETSPARAPGTASDATTAASVTSATVTGSPTVTDTAASFEKATTLYRGERFAEAVPLFEEIVMQHPENALAQARLGISLVHLERYDDGMPHLQRAIALDSTDWQSRSSLGVVYARIGEPEKGVQPAREAITIEPSSAVAWYNLGWILLRAKHPSQAVDAYSRAALLDPNDARTHYDLGLAWLAAGRRDRASAEVDGLRGLSSIYARQLEAEIQKSPSPNKR